MIKKIFFKDYYRDTTRKILKLKNKINNTNQKLLKCIYICIYNKLIFKNQCFIPMNCRIGNNVKFPHGLSGIYISNNAIIGNNCTIFQQVTIGSNNLNDTKSKGSPIIGDNVYIGAGAKIIGNVKIGNNVRVGANAIVVKDIPDNSTVVINDIKIIKHQKFKNNTFTEVNVEKK